VTIDTLAPVEVVRLKGDPRFINPDIASSDLGELLNEKYGLEWLDWEPETKWQMFSKDFSTDIHPIVKEKINATAALLLVDDFWMEWHIFEATVKALNSSITSFYMMEGCTPGEMAWAIEDAAKIRVEKFSDEVISYVRANCLTAGYILLPAQLSFARGGSPRTELEGKVHEAWTRMSSEKDFDIDEDPVGIQLARLNSVRHYIDSMREKSDAVLEKGKGR